MRKLAIVFLAIIVTTPFISLGGSITSDDIDLSLPSQTTMILEETIWRRASIRNFTKEPISLQDLSTILWAAYGVRQDGTRTVPAIQDIYAAHIYILLPEAVYKYNPYNHTLCFYKEGDYRYIGQYDAPLLIGIVWDTSLLSDGNLAAAQIGMIGQNIQLMSNALHLGSVICGDFPPIYTLDHIGLPSNEIPRIIIPLGHMVFPYDFTYRPFWISLLPRIQKSSLTLSDALEARNETDTMQHMITRAELTQLLWSSYGYSYLLDRAEYGMNFHISRHRTIPSAKAYYPLHIYAVSSSRISEYIPNIYNPLQFSYLLPRFPFPVFTYLKPLYRGDFRDEIATATSNPASASAPVLIICVLNLEKTHRVVDFSAEEWWWLWYYEAGSAVHNMLLTSAAWNLSTTITFPVDAEKILSTLELDENYIPIAIVPAGKTKK